MHETQEKIIFWRLRKKVLFVKIISPYICTPKNKAIALKKERIGSSVG